MELQEISKRQRAAIMSMFNRNIARSEGLKELTLNGKPNMKTCEEIATEANFYLSQMSGTENRDIDKHDVLSHILLAG